MEGVFITTATGKEIEDQISLMDKRTIEWTMRAARGECAWNRRTPARTSGDGRLTLETSDIISQDHLT